jgi:cell division protein FtsW
MSSATLKNAANLPWQARVDWTLLSLWWAVVSVGIVMIASASVSFAEANYGDAWFFVKRHIVWLGLGIGGGILVAAIPTRLWSNHGGWLLILALLLLMAVLVPGIGRKVNGSQRWLQLGPLTFQASEAVKFCTIVFFASYLARRGAEMRQQWRGFIKPVVVIGLIGLLLLLEPDFGTTVVLVATVVAMMFLAGIKLFHFSLLVAAGAGGLAAIAIFSPYRMQRLITFLDPWADQFNSGYQLTQSLIAFGRGEWFGVGLGHSVQKLFYLPEAHTDFIFAIIAEEFGLIGSAIVMGLFALLMVRLFSIAQQAIAKQAYFCGFSVFGIAIMMSGQAMINVGVASGFLPTKGLTLPFISYGGSSLLISCALMALVMRIHWEIKALPELVVEKPTKKAKQKVKKAAQKQVKKPTSAASANDDAVVGEELLEVAANG